MGSGQGGQEASGWSVLHPLGTDVPAVEQAVGRLSWGDGGPAWMAAGLMGGVAGSRGGRGVGVSRLPSEEPSQVSRPPATPPRGLCCGLSRPL